MSLLLLMSSMTRPRVAAFASLSRSFHTATTATSSSRTKTINNHGSKPPRQKSNSHKIYFSTWDHFFRNNNNNNNHHSLSFASWKKRNFGGSSLCMTSNDDDDDDGDDGDDDKGEESTKTVESEWDMKGLKQEVSRWTMRLHKKIGKASTRLRKAKEMMEQLTAPTPTTQQRPLLENDDDDDGPDIDALELDVRQLQSQLQQLVQLEQLIADKKGRTVLPPNAAQLALDLGVDDQPPQRPERGPTKKKGPRSKNPPKTRLPYRRFYSVNKTEIRVGKQAEDNDELSLSPQHRAGSDWWMHASGCPGSHVVIRCSDDPLEDEVVQDAAALAARQSKCNGPLIKVSMTRCRHIQKPMGAKAGLVQLTGPVRTVTVNMKEAAKRLERLDSTVVVN